MKVTELIQYSLLICLAVVALESCNSQPPTRILFIGNSYTVLNDGLDKQLKGLAASAETKCIARGGYTLENHWNDGTALSELHEGTWGYVVLQEQSQTAVVHRDKFYHFARKFDEEIRRNGAKTILLMTWERPDSKQFGVTTENLAVIYTTLGKELGVAVAPVGLAFAGAIRGKPELTLYIQDGHPTMEGTYLAACVLYRIIFQESPVGNPFSVKTIPADTRDYLQRIAGENF